MIVMTSLDITVDQARRLQTRATQSRTVRGVKKKLKHALVWGRSSIERLLVKQPWVSATYFDHQLLPGFVPLSRSDALDMADQPDLKLVGRRAELASVDDFFKSSDAVLIVVAAGGSGKSRFLRAIPAATRGTNRRSAWLRRPGIGTIEDGLRGGLPTHQSLVLALDDAGRELDEVHQLAAVAGRDSPAPNTKVILAVRSADLDAVESALRSVPSASYRVLKLPALKLNDAVELAVLESRNLDKAIAERLAKHFGPNLFLLRAAVQQVRAGESPTNIVKTGRLRNLVAERLVREATTHLKALRPEQETERFLLQCALDVPIAINESSVEHTTLHEAGLLRTVGATLRFRADVEGDVLLGYLLEKPWARAVLSYELSSRPDFALTRVRNLAAAGGDHPEHVICSICQGWLDAAPTTERSDRRAVLAALKWCVHAAPEIASRICEEYVRTAETHSTEDFGPVVLALGRCGKPVASLRLLRILRNLGLREGMSSNYQFVGATKEVASLAHLSPTSAGELLKELKHWLSTGCTKGDADIVQAALCSLLSPVMNWHTSDGATMSMHERALGATPAVLTIRTAAFDIVATMLGHADTHIRLAAARVLSEHAHKSGGGFISAPELRNVQRDEFVRIVPIIQKCLDVETDLEALDVLHDGLVFRWAAERPGASEAEAVLRSTSWPALLRAYQLCSKPWEFRLNISDTIAAAPAKNRWSWWVDQRVSGDSQRPSPDDVARLIEMLTTRFPGVDGLQLVATCLDGTKQPWLLLDDWCNRDPALFRSAVAQLAIPAPARLLVRAIRRFDFASGALDLVTELKRLLAENAPLSHADEMLEDVRRIDVNPMLEIAKLFVERPELDHRRFGLRQIRYTHIPRSNALDLLELALRDGLWLDGWQSVWSLIYDADGAAALAARPLLRDRIVDRLVEVLRSEEWHRHGNEGWYLEQAALVTLGNDLSLRLEVLKRSASNESFWSEPTAKIVAPLVAGSGTLRLVAHALGDVLASEQAHPAACGHLLGAATEGGWPSETLEIARDCIGASSPSMQRVGVLILSEMRENAEACAELAMLAARPGPLQQPATYALSNFTLPRGVWSGPIGAAPPAFVEIQENLKRARAIATEPGARQLVANLESNVAGSIERHIQHDQEFLDPR
jgi:hypothetical protein